MKQLRPHRLVAITLAFACCTCFAARSGAAVSAIAVTGQDVPDGNGKFGQVLDGPVLNNAGKVAFRAALSNVQGNFGNDAIYAYSGGSLAKIVRENETPPEGNGEYNGFSTPLIDAAGQIGFGAVNDMTSSGLLDDSGLYLHTGSSIVKAARENETEPEGNGVFGDLTLEVFNSGGQFAFSSALRNTSGGTLDNTGVFKYDGSALVNIIRKNDLVPNGNGRYLNTDDRALNGVGQVAFHAQLTGTSGVGLDDFAIYRTTGAGLTEVVRENALVPDGGGRYHVLFGPALNNAGQVAFHAFLRDTPFSSADDTGIYLWNQASGLSKVVRENSATPEGNGVFDIFGDPSRAAEGIALAGNGHVAFQAELRNSVGGSTDDEGIYVFNGTSITKIARESDTVPGGNGTFAAFGTPVINAIGHVAFQANLEDTSGVTSDNEAIYLWNGTSLVQAARKGEIIDGITLGGSMIISDGSGGQDGRASGLNDSDQIVFQSGLTPGGGSGVFMFTPGTMPGPTLPGDYNDNDVVDAADFAVWREYVGQAVALPNDITPGMVTADDYGVWRAHFGQTIGSGAGATAGLPGSAVPEPASWLLGAAALTLLLAVRHRSLTAQFSL